MRFIKKAVNLTSGIEKRLFGTPLRAHTTIWCAMLACTVTCFAVGFASFAAAPIACGCIGVALLAFLLIPIMEDLIDEASNEYDAPVGPKGSDTPQPSYKNTHAPSMVNTSKRRLPTVERSPSIKRLASAGGMFVPEASSPQGDRTPHAPTLSRQSYKMSGS